MLPVITLTTDFGTRDPYVAAMKGVICGIGHNIKILDLSHDIAPQNVIEGSLFLAGALPYFPEKTIHVAVVDPGVGTDRKPIAIRAGGQIVLCPDNGLATLFLRQFPLIEVRAITNPHIMRSVVSATFHGRDIFAPAAAHLASGTPLCDLGEPLHEIVLLDVPEPVKSPQGIAGAIIHIDHFGNLISNISRAMIERPDGASVHVGVCDIGPIRRTYGDAAPGAPLALFGSSDYLEIAVNRGCAQSVLGINCDDQIVVVK